MRHLSYSWRRSRNSLRPHPAYLFLQRYKVYCLYFRQTTPDLLPRLGMTPESHG